MTPPASEKNDEDRSLERLSVECWREAGPALAAARAEELRSMTAAEALAAADSLLSLAQPPRDSVRWRTSGLVEQQRLFQRLRRRRGQREP